MKVIIRPNSRQDGEKWIPEGMVSFPSGPNLTERRELCEDTMLNTKEEADQYFIEVCKKKYKVQT